MKKNYPNFLKFSIALSFLLISNFLLAQNADVILTVDWPQWSTENKVEFYDSNDMLLQTIDNGFDGSGAAANPYDETTTAVSYAVNSSTTAGYYVIVYDTYGDGWNGNGSLTITADGQTALSFDGNFDTSATNSQITQTIYFAINAQDNASFSYPQASYCPATDSNPTPSISGETGGTFSSTSGLSLNVSTGEINLSASTDGTYQVTYTTTAPNQNSSQETVIIGGSSTFQYTTSSATQTDADLSPTTTGPSGTFSSTTGLSINSATGIIDVSTSTPGTYCVTYSTTGTCPAGSIVLTDDVIITTSNFPGVSQYFDNNKKYIEYIPGTMPVIISAPHGGVLQGGGRGGLSNSQFPADDNSLPTRNCGTNERDDNTDILIREIQQKCYEQYGLYPYIIINNLHRSRLDPNRNESEATCNNATAKLYFDAFHSYIDDASAEITTNYGKGLYIDLHGQSHSIPRIEAGYNLQSNAYDNNLNTTNNLNAVTVKNLIENNIQNLGFDDIVRGTQSLGGLMQTTGGSEYAALGHAGCSRTQGYRTVPSHISSGTSQGNCDDTNPGNNAYFAGDYYNNIRHGSGNPAFAHSVVQQGSEPNVPGGGGTIDGIMTEVNRRVRDIGNVYSGAPYNRANDGRSATIPFFARDYGTVIKDFIDLHYNDFSKFSYTNSTYDTTDSDPTPTITGISGGTFTSSNSGLVINSSTGAIDLSASSAGVYTVTYLAPNIESYYKKVSTITITSSTALDDASFTYNASSYCQNDINPSATITGESGGTFSSTAGLNFVNTNSGEINLSTSSTGTYTVTYTTQNPGQNSDTFDVTINAADVATFSYATDTACISGADLTATTTGESGTFSSTTGLVINSASGLIDVSASTPGTYTVSYLTTGTCPITLTDSVTINAADVATFTYSAASYDVSDPNPTPTFTGLGGGTFTSTSGIVLNSSDGTIDLSTSDPGNYTITYTVMGTCNTVVETQNVQITGIVLDVDDEELTTTFTIYPNPTIDIVKIKSNKTITKVIVHDMLGRKVKTVKLTDIIQVDLSNLERATYLLTFFNDNKMLGSKPVVKK